MKGSYTMTDVQNSVDSDFLEAGRGTFQQGAGGWNMAAVSKVIRACLSNITVSREEHSLNNCSLNCSHVGPASRTRSFNLLMFS